MTLSVESECNFQCTKARTRLLNASLLLPISLFLSLSVALLLWVLWLFPRKKYWKNVRSEWQISTSNHNSLPISWCKFLNRVCRVIHEYASFVDGKKKLFLIKNEETHNRRFLIIGDLFMFILFSPRILFIFDKKNVDKKVINWIYWLLYLLSLSLIVYAKQIFARPFASTNLISDNKNNVRSLSPTAVRVWFFFFLGLCMLLFNCFSFFTYTYWNVQLEYWITGLILSYARYNKKAWLGVDHVE